MLSEIMTHHRNSSGKYGVSNHGELGEHAASVHSAGQWHFSADIRSTEYFVVDLWLICSGRFSADFRLNKISNNIIALQ